MMMMKTMMMQMMMMIKLMKIMIAIRYSSLTYDGKSPRGIQCWTAVMIMHNAADADDDNNKGLFINDVINFRGYLDPPPSPSSSLVTFWLPPPLIARVTRDKPAFATKQRKLGS